MPLAAVGDLGPSVPAAARRTVVQRQRAVGVQWSTAGQAPDPATESRVEAENCRAAPEPLAQAQASRLAQRRNNPGIPGPLARTRTHSPDKSSSAYPLS